MRLCRMEIQGFKSFAEKTVMNFDRGITVIVGPNGTGKSNIADAIRWVLGEQNARELRGSRFEDVIFAGTMSRQPLGFAEVSLTFDNSDGQLPVAFSEVTVTRRIYRSGETECLINKTSCRLKDIHDLFRDTGLGRDSLAIIGQNKVDAILNDHAQERRGVFEEAAGITRYKQRKQEALRKLAETEQNIVRLTDIVAALAEQLGPLKEKADKARTYQKLAQTLRACKIALVLHQLATEQELLAQSETRHGELSRQEAELRRQVAQQEAALEQEQVAYLNLDESCRQLGEKIQETEQAWQRVLSQMAVVAAREEQAQKEVRKAQEEQARLKQRQQDLQARLAMQEAHLIELAEQQKTLQATMAEEENRFQQLSTRLAEANQALQSQHDAVLDNLESLTASRHELSALTRELALERERLKQLEREQATLAQEYQCAQQVLAEKSTCRQSLQDQLAACRCTAQAQEQALQEGYEQLAELREQEKELLGRFNQLTSRRKVLATMQQAYEGFNSGIKCVLQCTQPWRSRIYGAVAELITAPAAYAAAIETALGGAMQYIVVDDENTARQAIDYLRAKSAGRATFLPLTTIRPLGVREKEKTAATLPGALGIAADLVTASARFTTVVQFLLGRIIVAEDMEAALSIARYCHFATKVVTLAGDVVNPGGSLTGGSRGRRENSFWGRAQEIARCNRELTHLETQLAEVRQKLAQLTQKCQELREAREQTRQIIHQREIEYAETAREEENVRQNLIRLRTTLDVVLKDFTACRARENALRQQQRELEERVKTLESQEQQHQEVVKKQREQMARWEQEQAAQREELTRLKIRAAELEQALKAASQVRQDLWRQQETLGRELARYAADLERAVQDQGELARTRRELLARQDELAALRQRLHMELERRQQERAEKQRLIARQEKAVREARKSSEDMANMRHEVEVAIAKSRLAVESRLTYLHETYQLTVAAAQQVAYQAPVPELEEKAADLTRRIEELGPVNVGAIEEYEALSARHAFITVQLQDLTAAKQRLAAVIEEIDAAMTKKLAQSFQQIKIYFNEFFRRLFGGGQADLCLTTPERLLDTGVEIVVQPPGKKRQNLALLSGGERALTVIALLFALLKYHPSPLCVLDEIDAPLDEANVCRFRDFLQEFAANAVQFIVITHRKGTMEAADVLYGVTMPEYGVSKLVSVKLMEKAG